MNESVLVVGARGGVGCAVARRLIRDGRTVIGTVRDGGQSAGVRAAIPGLSDVIELDLVNADDVRTTLVSRLADTALGAAIVCAAECRYRPLEFEPLAAARRTMEVNAISNLAIYQACMPALRRSAGKLVLVSSNSGLISMPFLGAYQASKFALEALGDAMRLEAARWGVRVVLIEPGGMDTAMSRAQARSISDDIERLSAEEGRLYRDLYTGFRDILAGAHGMTPVSEVADLVAAVLAADDPQPRYPVGEDTAFLLGKKKELPDREMDAYARSLYGLA